MTQDIDETTLRGGWKLVVWQIDYSDDRPPSYPYGSDADGLLLYTNDGMMSANIAYANRSQLSTESTRHAPETEKCEAFDSYFSYAGHYHVEDEVVVHRVSHSLNPNFPGTEQRRHIRFVEGDLELSAQDQLPGSEVTRTHRLRWRKLASNQ